MFYVIVSSKILWIATSIDFLSQWWAKWKLHECLFFWIDQSRWFYSSSIELKFLVSANKWKYKELSCKNWHLLLRCRAIEFYHLLFEKKKKIQMEPWKELHTSNYCDFECSIHRVRVTSSLSLWVSVQYLSFNFMQFMWLLFIFDVQSSFLFFFLFAIILFVSTIYMNMNTEYRVPPHNIFPALKINTHSRSLT